MGLKDLEKSTDEFDFRLRDGAQVVEIVKDSSAITGIVTNYIHHHKNRRNYKSKIRLNKVTLSPEQAKNTYNIIQNSGILKIPSEEKIKNWKEGYDGVPYFIEYSDKGNHQFKTYWMPSAQDSFPKALIVSNFINSIHDTLHLAKMYTTFKNDLPHKGCYYSGGMVTTCYIDNAFNLGYSGSTKLPLGFSLQYNRLRYRQSTCQLRCRFTIQF